MGELIGSFALGLCPGYLVLSIVAGVYASRLGGQMLTNLADINCRRGLLHATVLRMEAELNQLRRHLAQAAGSHPHDPR